MAIGKTTATQFAKIIADGMNSRDETLDTAIGPVVDIIIDPMSMVLESQNDRVVYLSELTSLKNVEKLVPDHVDDLVYNEALVRWGGSRSITIVTFSRTQTPTSNITIPTNFPLSTFPDPTTGMVINFRTIESKTMYSASPDAYYNANTGKYELDVAVASISVGKETEVGARTIKVMRRVVSGFDEVFNRSKATSGRGTETNRGLADRYLISVEGTSISNPAGIKKYILDNFSSVEDTYIVYGEDDNLTRDQIDAGAVDIWIMGSSPIERTYTTSYPGIETLIEIDRQPLISIKSVSTTGGVTFVEGTDYLVVKGIGEYAYSNRGSDGIKFLVGGNAPSNLQDPVYIVYEYNSIISTLASFFTQPEFYSFGMDKLFRWAQVKYIEIEAMLKVNSGNPDTVMSLSRNAVKSYINGLKLNNNVEEFDIDSVVSRIAGVDNWVYTTLAYKGGTGVQDLPIYPYEYPRIEEADFVINLVS